jgi:DUF971 family protein
MKVTPITIEPLSPIELFIEWNTGEKFSLAYLEIRYHCPCAHCIDEKTGKRILEKSSIPPTIRPQDVQLVGHYAIQITWSDAHQTGIYHYDWLFELCRAQGKSLGKSVEKG